MEKTIVRVTGIISMSVDGVNLIVISVQSVLN